jgi:hypothetical protein
MKLETIKLTKAGLVRIVNACDLEQWRADGWEAVAAAPAGTPPAKPAKPKK